MCWDVFIDPNVRWAAEYELALADLQDNPEQAKSGFLLFYFDRKIANLISKLNFYKLIPYPMDNLLNRSAQTGPPNARKRRPVFPPAGRSVVPCTPQMAPRTSFLSRQPDVIASFSLSKPVRPLVS